MRNINVIATQFVYPSGTKSAWSLVPDWAGKWYIDGLKVEAERMKATLNFAYFEESK